MGSHVVDALLASQRNPVGHIVVLDDLSGGSVRNVPEDPRVEFIEGSITDVTILERLFKQHSFEQVFHLAAYAAEGLSHFIRGFNYENNLLGSVRLINASVNHGVKTFVFTSSIAVYGNGEPPFVESKSPTPIDPYGIAKYSVELDLMAAHELFGLNYVIFRPHNVYGEKQNVSDPYRNVIGIFMRRLMEGKSMPIFGDGSQRRAFTYVGDIAPAIAESPMIPESLNQVFNVGSDDHHSVRELADLVAKAMGTEASFEFRELRHEAHTAYCDHSKMRRVFPSLTDTSLEEGLTRMATWVRSHPLEPSKPFRNIEVERQLPPSWR